MAKAFATFEKAVNKAVNTDLLSSTPNPTQFTSDVQAAFTTLSTNVASDIQNLAADECEPGRCRSRPI